MDIFTGPSLVPDGEIKRMVIFLHGYGADGHDLLGLARPLSRQLANTAFYSLHAPHPCELGVGGLQWFSLHNYDPNLMRRDPQRMQVVFEAMGAAAEALIPRLEKTIVHHAEKHNLDYSKIALLGFSQGTMLSLFASMLMKNRLACVVGFSGALLGGNLQHKVTCKPPICLIHGTADDIVPYEAMAHAKSELSKLGLTVESHSCPDLGHGIDIRGVRAAIEFLDKHL